MTGWGRLTKRILLFIFFVDCGIYGNFPPPPSPPPPSQHLWKFDYDCFFFVFQELFEMLWRFLEGCFRFSFVMVAFFFKTLFWFFCHRFFWGSFEWILVGFLQHYWGFFWTAFKKLVLGIHRFDNKKKLSLRSGLIHFCVLINLINR